MGLVITQVDTFEDEDKPSAGTACVTCKMKGHFCPASTWKPDSDDPVCSSCLANEECERNKSLPKYDTAEWEFVTDVPLKIRRQIWDSEDYISEIARRIGIPREWCVKIKSQMPMPSTKTAKAAALLIIGKDEIEIKKKVGISKSKVTEIAKSLPETKKQKRWILKQDKPPIFTQSSAPIERTYEAIDMFDFGFTERGEERPNTKPKIEVTVEPIREQLEKENNKTIHSGYMSTFQEAYDVAGAEIEAIEASLTKAAKRHTALVEVQRSLRALLEIGDEKDEYNKIRASDGTTHNKSDVPVNELCTALAEAERGGQAFISIKWFLDSFLPNCQFGWSKDSKLRQAVLSRAIQIGLVLTKKVTNPKKPEYPTTTIRLK